MANPLVLCLEQTLDNNDEIRNAAAERIMEYQKTNPIEYAQTLMSIFQEPTFSLVSRKAAIVNLWRIWPSIEQNDVPKGYNPHDIIPQELTEQILEVSFNLLNVNQVDQSQNILSYYAATLYGRISAYYIHDNLQSQIIQRLCAAISAHLASNELNAIPNCIHALMILLDSTGANDGEEIESILNLILTTLQSNKDSKVSILMIELFPHLNEEIQPYFQIEDTAEAIITLFISYFQRDVIFHRYLYNFFESIYQNKNIMASLIAIHPHLLLQLHSELVQSILQTFGQFSSILSQTPESVENYAQVYETTSQNVFAALSLVSELTKIENLSDNNLFGAGSIESNYETIVTSLIGIISTIDDDECDLPDSPWTPAREAFHVIGKVIELAPDEVAVTLIQPAQELLQNEGIGPRCAGLKILLELTKSIGFSDITSFEVHESELVSNSPETLRQAELQYRQQFHDMFATFVPIFCELSGDASSRIRCEAIRGLKIGVRRLVKYKLITPEDAETILPVLQHMNDHPIIVSQTVSLAAEICSIQGFAKTSEILPGIFEQAITASQTFEKSPFHDIADIIQSADEKAISDFLPAVLTAYEQTCNDPELAFAQHELHDVIFTYLIRLRTAPVFQQHVQTLAQILLKYGASDSPFASDVLDLLGLLGQVSFEQFCPTFLEPTLQLFQASLESNNEEDIRLASLGISFLVLKNEGKYLEQKTQIAQIFIPILLQIVQNLDLSSSARTNAVTAISDLGNSAKQFFGTVAHETISIISAFCSGLEIMMQEDEIDAQLMATAIGKVLSLVFEIHPDQAQNYLQIAHNLLQFGTLCDERIERFNHCLLDIGLFVSQSFNNTMLEFIEDDEADEEINENGTIGDLFVELAGNCDPSISEKGKQILNILHYTID